MKKPIIMSSAVGLMIIVIFITSCSSAKQYSEPIPPTPPPTSLPPTKVPIIVQDNTHDPVLSPLTLTGKQGFTLEDQSGVFLFEVENTNARHAIQDSQFQVAVYDDTNTVLDSGNNHISVVLPGERQFIAYDFYLEENQVADHIEVQLQSGHTEEIDLTETVFSVENVQYLPNEYSPQVSGIINNNLTKSISDLKVTAVAYDDQGEVIGGGFTYLNFLGPNSKSAVGIRVKVSQNPALVELYASLSSYPVFSEEQNAEAGLILLDYGFTQAAYSAGATFLVQNTNTIYTIEDSQYRVEAFDEAGTVLTTDEGYIDLVFPGETQAIYTNFYLPDGLTLGNVIVQINQGELGISSYTTNPFTANQVKYIKGDYYNSVTAIIANADSSLIEGPRIVAVGYDERGKIIGGGYTYLDFVPGKSQSGVSIRYEGEIPPTTVNVFASLSGLSSLSSGNQETIIELADVGYGIEGSNAVVCCTMRNTSKSVIDSTLYQITGYDSEGYVVDTDSGYAGLIYPGQSMAGYGELMIPDGLILQKVEVQLLQGESATPLTNEFPFSTENATFIAGSFSPKITGIVKNAFEKDINDIKVLAIAYDAADKIIGGGYTFVEFVPAKGQAAVEVSVTVGGPPARVELYPSFSGLSKISE